MLGVIGNFFRRDGYRLFGQADVAKSGCACGKAGGVGADERIVGRKGGFGRAFDDAGDIQSHDGRVEGVLKRRAHRVAGRHAERG